MNRKYFIFTAHNGRGWMIYRTNQIRGFDYSYLTKKAPKELRDCIMKEYNSTSDKKISSSNFWDWVGDGRFIPLTSIMMSNQPQFKYFMHNVYKEYILKG